MNTIRMKDNDEATNLIRAFPAILERNEGLAEKSDSSAVTVGMYLYKSRTRHPFGHSTREPLQPLHTVLVYWH